MKIVKNYHFKQSKKVRLSKIMLLNKNYCDIWFCNLLSKKVSKYINNIIYYIKRYYIFFLFFYYIIYIIALLSYFLT